MSKKPMTVAEAKAALRAASKKNAAKQAERDAFLRCGAGHLIYAGTRGTGCGEPGCRR